MSVRFLVIEGNSSEIRDFHRSTRGITPAEDYGNLLVRIAGGGAYDVLLAADAGASLPKGMTFADYDAVVITGSALNIWQMAPEATRQIEVARAVFKANVPFFGSCWGLQLATVAAGGSVHANPRGYEVGFARKIRVTKAGAVHPLLEGRPDVFDAPCTHYDEVASLPPDSTLLASNDMSQVQAAEIRHEGGTFWGVQYHPEYSPAYIAFLIEKRIRNMVRDGFFANEAQQAAYIADLRALDAEPGIKHVAWRHGLGPDVTDPQLRVTEIRNFIEARVKPRALMRAA
ncbi:MAG: type 1 glutamine amidotransferase [Proteobacteria bacterium]|nr:type 1 glutamine amidotransferase [Pseudomonadota bacterium]